MAIDLDTLTKATERGPVARVVITRVAGSTPREAGTEMYVWADKTQGTIGGGRLEFDAISRARDLLANGTIAEHVYPLGPRLGQCCGGSVTTVTEVFTAHTLPQLPYVRSASGAAPIPPRIAQKAARLQPTERPVSIDGWLIETAPPAVRNLWVWGAGHVGRALINTLAPLPDFKIHWVDISADRFPDHIPDGVMQIIAADPARMVANCPRDAEHIILTHDHDIDFALCHGLLHHGFDAAGLIGSATKWARFTNRLMQLGHDRQSISRIACLLGIV